MGILLFVPNSLPSSHERGYLTQIVFYWGLWTQYSYQDPRFLGRSRFNIDPETRFFERNKISPLEFKPAFGFIVD